MKIQHSGHRRTISLHHGKAAEAADEACAWYRRIVLYGWEEVTRTKRDAYGPDRPARFPSMTPPANLARSAKGFPWEEQLIHRQYGGQKLRQKASPLCVRIEHEQISHYFPLGASDRGLASKQAAEIYETVLAEGWEAACHRFPRELTLAFHWWDNPLAWTYTTIHTNPAMEARSAVRSGTGQGRIQVVIAEADVGIREALVECVDQMEGFPPALAFSNATAALHHLDRQGTHLFLANQHLADRPGSASGLEKLRPIAPGVTGLVYSVHEDSEELFRTTPGGAGSYFFRRTAPNRFLDPLKEALAGTKPSPKEIAGIVWQYFHNALGSISSGDLDELTGLTPREHEVLALLSKGHPHKLIAERLRISTYTVHVHVRNIFEKLRVHNRVEAVVKYFQK